MTETFKNTTNSFSIRIDSGVPTYAMFLHVLQNLMFKLKLLKTSDFLRILVYSFLKKGSGPQLQRETIRCYLSAL